jgi:hypothetical protein
MTRKSKRRKGQSAAAISAAALLGTGDAQVAAERPDEPDAAAPAPAASATRTDIERADERKTGSIESVTADEPGFPPHLQEQ